MPFPTATAFSGPPLLLASEVGYKQATGQACLHITTEGTSACSTAESFLV